jgi:hypothetical protein
LSGWSVVAFFSEIFPESLSYSTAGRQKHTGHLNLPINKHINTWYLIVSIVSRDGRTSALVFSQDLWKLPWQRRFNDFFLRFSESLSRCLSYWIPDSFEWKPLDVLYRLQWREVSK